jgi:hypothetical protein
MLGWSRSARICRSERKRATMGRGETLHGDAFAELIIDADLAIDFCHAAHADQFDQPIGAYDLSDGASGSSLVGGE